MLWLRVALAKTFPRGQCRDGPLLRGLLVGPHAVLCDGWGLFLHTFDVGVR